MPDFGVYLLWPEPGDDWYHPDDALTVAELIPSDRVLLRKRYDGTYYYLHYGQKLIRVRPTMWQNLPAIDLEIDQCVEILARHGKNEPGIGFITDIMFNSHNCKIDYYVRRGAMTSPAPFSREDLRPLEVKCQLRTGFYLHLRPSSLDLEDEAIKELGCVRAP